MIMVHGGAKAIPPFQDTAHRAGCLAALEAGAGVLRDGGAAVEAVVAAIRVLEADPTFNAGYGSVRNADGKVECDAALMDGSTLDVGAVAAVSTVRHPIDLAHVLLRDAPVLLVGAGAARYAAEKGLALCEPRDLEAPDGVSGGGCDTVGCVAFDNAGRLAAGTSTGGLEGVRPGRVGDSPIPGCGLAAEDECGAVAFSGDGESLLRLTLAARVMTGLSSHSAAEAAEQAIALMPRVGGEAGCIVLGRDGAPAVAHNSPQFAFGVAGSARPPSAFLHKDEFS